MFVLLQASLPPAPQHCKKCKTECTFICGNSKETGCMNMSYEKEIFDSEVNKPLIKN